MVFAISHELYNRKGSEDRPIKQPTNLPVSRATSQLTRWITAIRIYALCSATYYSIIPEAIPPCVSRNGHTRSISPLSFSAAVSIPVSSHVSTRYYPLNVIFVDMIFSRRLNQPTRIQVDTLLLRINFIYIGSSIVDIIIKSYEMIERSKILIIASHKIIRSVVAFHFIALYTTICNSSIKSGKFRDSTSRMMN